MLAVLSVAWAGLVHAEQMDKVNINTADAKTIARVLNGVGLKKAEAIVSYREANGRFDAPTDLTRVKGIGASTIKKNAGKIVVSESDMEKKPEDKKPPAVERRRPTGE